MKKVIWSRTAHPAAIDDIVCRLVGRLCSDTSCACTDLSNAFKDEMQLSSSPACQTCLIDSLDGEIIARALEIGGDGLHSFSHFNKAMEK
jgi:hypothetical protein